VLILTFLVPWIHSITFNILNKPIVEKILLTAISMAYLLLEAPLHYFLAAGHALRFADVHAHAVHPVQPDAECDDADCLLRLGHELGVRQRTPIQLSS
jgi:hypothetical protein